MHGIELSSPISRLEMLSAGERLTDETLILMEHPQSEAEPKTRTGYISRKLKYQQLTSNLTSDLEMSKINAKLQTLETVMYVPSTLVTIDNSSPFRKFSISAVSENERASINGISAYNMTIEVPDIVSSTVLPRVQAISSPWAEMSNVMSVYGDSYTNMASQILGTSVLVVANAEYVKVSDIMSSLDGA